MNQPDRGYQLGLLSFIRPSTLVRLTPRLASLDPQRIGRLAAILGGSIASLPLNAWERIRHNSEIKNQAVGPDPIFIIGHWRSGTTHMHNLLSQDPQFDCLRMFQALAPDCSVATQSWLPQLLQRVVPNKRPMDNMEWPMHAPQEEEIPLAKLTPYSWYLQFLFPQQALSTFEQNVLLEGAPTQAYQEVQDKLLQLVKVAAVHAKGKRLLLKNPVNTARIPMLRELFPEARFIFVHRNPYEVFPSTLNLHRKILGITSLQTYSEEHIESNVLEIYPRLLERYLEDTKDIPTNRLIEVGYQDLVDDPQTCLENIYHSLELGGYDAAQPRIQSYLSEQQNYQTNQFSNLSERIVEVLNQRWAMAFEQWGYQRRTPNLLEVD